MSRIWIGVLITGMLFLLGLWGLALNSPALVCGVITLWTPAAWFVGYSAFRAGVQFRSPVYGAENGAPRPVQAGSR